MNSTKIDPKFIGKSNPRVGLIALASDFMIEKDFINVIKNKKIDFFVNRIECYNPLTKENLIKMSNKITDVTKDILPDQDLDCVVYGCTSGTIAAGHESIEQKVKVAKPAFESFPHILLMGIRFTFAASLLIWWFPIPKGYLKRIFAASLVANTLQYSITYTGLDLIDASSAVILVQMEVTFGVIFAYFMLKEKPTIKALILSLIHI